MPRDESFDRICSVLAARIPPASPIVAGLIEGVIEHRSGVELGPNRWQFALASQALLAAIEILRLTDGAASVVVITGEGDLVGRAKAAQGASREPGVFLCPATAAIAAESLPPDLWIAKQTSRGTEMLAQVCREGELVHSGPSPYDIPLPRDAFVARDQEVDRLTRTLAQSFLVTVVGLPGSGKSELTSAALRMVESEYEDGIIWIDAADCRSREDIVEHLRRATWEGRVFREEPFGMLVARLQELSAVIVFDNCEHLVEEVRRLTESLLSATTKLCIVATSNSLLGASKERSFFMPPLSLPAEGAEIQVLRDYSSAALNLFSARATAVQEEFDLGPGNVRAVAEICRKLEGHPLAIEIVAGRLSARSLKSLTKPGTNVHVLKHTAPHRPHHKTLKAAFEHALSVTPPELRGFLAELSLFVGSFAFEDADSIWSQEEQRMSVSDALDELVRRSMLMFHMAEGRYQIPPLLHVVVAQSPDAERRRLPFCRHMFGVCSRATAHFADGREPEGLELLDAVYADLDGAIRYALTASELHQELLQVLLKLPHYWLRRNKLASVEDVFRGVLDLVQLTTEERANFLIFLAASLSANAQFTEAEGYVHEAIRVSEELEDNRFILVKCYGNLAYFSSEMGNFSNARDAYHKAIELARSAGNPIQVRSILLNASDCWNHWLLSQSPPRNKAKLLAESQAFVEEAYNLIKPGDAFWLQSAHTCRADTYLAAGDLENAKRLYVRAALVCEKNYPFEASQVTERLVHVSIIEEKWELAARLLGLAISLRVENERPRPDRETKNFDKMVETLAEKLGDRLDDHLVFGASIAISDLSIITDVRFED